MKTSSARLVGLTKELRTQWQDTKAYWKDAKSLEFERAALLRDEIVELRKQMVSEPDDALHEFAAAAGRPGPLFVDRGRRGRRSYRR